MNYPENNKFYRLDEMMQSQVDGGMIPGGHLRIIKTVSAYTINASAWQIRRADSKYPIALSIVFTA